MRIKLYQFISFIGAIEE